MQKTADKKNLLSTLHRNDLLQKLEQETYDVLIIGGGITGAGIALDATSRGLKVALIEKQDFAAGTSSRSTKLIHGGLRYLAQFEFGLVREVAKERKIIYNNAPHLVVPEKMFLPFIKNGTFNKWTAALGLWIYDFLGNVNKDDKHKILNAQEAKIQEPLLDEETLKGGGIYSEYRTEDSRLTIEILKTAAEKFGALCINYTELTNFTYSENKTLNGAEVTDLLQNRSYKIKAKKIINAAGPWVDIIRKMDAEVKGKTLHHTKGVHLVVPFHKFPVKQSIYFDALAGRMMFAIPHGETTYIGTTDTNFTNTLEEPLITKEDVEYILGSVNKTFPGVKLTGKDVISGWAGIRPLIHEEGKSPSEISRKDEVFISESGLISIAGGKLTGYRKMAEKVTDIVMKDFENSAYKKYMPSVTDTIKLGGGTFEDPQSWQAFFDENIKAAAQAEIAENEMARLLRYYGRNAIIIFEFANKLSAAEFNLLRAEIWYTVNFEGVTNIRDFLIRRTAMMYFAPDKISQLLPVIKKELMDLLELDEETINKQEQQFIELYKKASVFR